MNKLVCIVGMCGSGKSLVADELKKHDYQFLRFGQITLDLVKERGLEPTEENERRIREELRREQGMGAFARLNIPKIKELLKKSNVVVDGLYSWSEYKILKDNFQEQMQILAILASPELRYQRLEQRKEIDQEMRNRPITKEDAQKRDYAEIENIEKGGPIVMADHFIVNDSSEGQLVRNVKEFLGIRLSWDEYFMNQVYDVAKRGTCDRGRTGAIIVKDNRIISEGYVGSPPGMPHCDEVGHMLVKRENPDGSISEHCIRTIHAERNAIIQTYKDKISLVGATIYMKMSPCSVCADDIIKHGITRVVAEKKYHRQEGVELLKQAGVKVDIIYDVVEKYEK